jgi:hypothetical protein
MSQKALLLPAILAAVLVHQSYADSISIINADFENGSASWTTSTSDNGNYWSFVPFQVSNGSFQFNSQVARFWTGMNHVSGRLSQTLSATLQPSTTYTFSFQPVISGLTETVPQTFGPSFYAGSTAIPWDSFVTPALSSSRETIWTYELTTSATEALAGQNIKIEMFVETGLFPNAVGSQLIQFDNFTLEAVPEPSTYALLGIGAVATILFKLRRKKA